MEGLGCRVQGAGCRVQGLGEGAIASPQPAALEQRGNTLNGLRAFALKMALKPESGPD